MVAQTVIEWSHARATGFQRPSARCNAENVGFGAEKQVPTSFVEVEGELTCSHRVSVVAGRWVDVLGNRHRRLAAELPSQAIVHLPRMVRTRAAGFGVALGVPRGQRASSASLVAARAEMEGRPKERWRREEAEEAVQGCSWTVASLLGACRSKRRKEAASRERAREETHDAFTRAASWTIELSYMCTATEWQDTTL